MMRGLLIKDIRLMKNQKQFFVLTVLIAVAELSILDSPGFAIIFTTIMFGSFSINSISYDTFDNGEAYLFTLPVSRKKYAAEKYVLGIAMSVGWLAVMSVIVWVFHMIHPLDHIKSELIPDVVSALMVCTFMLAYMIPIHLRFAADKSRVVILLATAFFALAGFAVVKLFQIAGVELDGLLLGVSEAKLVVILACFIVLLLILSYFLSARIMERKEF